MSFQKSLPFTLHWEGGLSNRKTDYGGLTYRGVTQKIYDVYRDRISKVRQPVSLMTDDEMRDLYKVLFWDVAHCDDFKEPLDQVMFDSAVTFGVRGDFRFPLDPTGKAAREKVGAMMFLQGAISYQTLWVAEKKLWIVHPTKNQVTIDGIYGDETKKAFKLYSDARGQNNLAQRICILRQMFRRRRVLNDPSQSEYLGGWLNRDRDLLKLVYQMTAPGV